MPFVILKKVLSWDGTGRVRGKFVYRRVEHAHPFLLFAVGSYNSSPVVEGWRCEVCCVSSLSRRNENVAVRRAARNGAVHRQVAASSESVSSPSSSRTDWHCGFVGYVLCSSACVRAWLLMLFVRQDTRTHKHTPKSTN
jgi:hypothetical protein